MKTPCFIHRLFLLATPLTGWSQTASAQIFQGQSSGIFVNPDVPEGAVYEGAGTSSITWGRAQNSSTGPSGLTFHGAGFLMVPGMRVPVGSLTFRNGRIIAGTHIEAVDASLNFTLTLPSGRNLAQAFTLGIDATTNTSNEEASADSIRLLTPYSASPLVDGDKVYAMRLFFGASGPSAVGEREQVILLEDHSTEVSLDGVITPSFPLREETSPPGGIITFEAPAGPSGMTASGAGTSTFTTGVPGGTNGAASVFTAIPAETGAVRTEIPFVVGRLRYFNGTSTTDSLATGVTLRVNAGSPVGTFDFPLNLMTTTNSGNAREDADIIEVAAPVADRILEIDGIPHTARLFFSNPSTGGYTGVSRFSVREDARADAEIWLVITRWLPEPRPFALKMSQPSATDLLLSWPSEKGKSYRLQSSSNMLAFANDGGIITASNSSALVTRRIAGPAKFWRVLSLP